MRYHVYFAYGNCNQGDCNYGLVSFDTMEDACKFIRSTKRDNGSLEPYCCIIRGELLQESLLDRPLEKLI